MRRWERRRGVSSLKRSNDGCVWCGAPAARVLVEGGKRIGVCDGCAVAKHGRAPLAAGGAS